ncbi:zinc finger protein weckle-like [Bactrocera dorsalis]|uniref:Zinc finger protein weckle-like n=1 Tax=Bactrocera dorsalis TaxID=27457 RepID=A0ABM3IZU0_BACDO|nr:zinc finger protein weckle-like [Bactrocera dorsalis]
MNVVRELRADEKLNTNIDKSAPWHLWCRLCAKQDIQNISVFFKDEHMVASTGNGEENNLGLNIAITKYFCVQIKMNDELPDRLCTECFSLVTSLVNFNERVIKVQEMYEALQSLSDITEVDYQTLRSKFGVPIDDRPHEFLCRTLGEVHLHEEKPKINEFIEKSFMEEAVIDILPKVCNKVIEIKEENSIELTPPADEDAYDFENKDACDEDPFGSDSDIKSDENSSSSESSVNNSRRKRIKKKHGTEIDETDFNYNKKRKIKSNEDFKQAEESGDGESNEIYTCKECAQTFKRISNYRTHMERKHGQLAVVPKFTCTDCPFTCNTQAQLNHHAVKHLPLTKRRIVPCPHCDHKFPTKTYVAQHIKYVHMNERSFICEECGEAVRSKGQLKQHMLTHTDYAPFECEVCKKGFKNQVRLKKHMETHNPNKHICAECGLQLNSKATLNRHLLVHSDVMQHKCDFCGRAFKRAKALKNHLILHTGLKPYSCDFCERTFANGSNCRTHKRKAHPEELAALEASGEKAYTKNIPKLAVLKSVTRAADNLAPVVSKQSGNFAFGKKPKLPPDSVGTVSKKQAKTLKQTIATPTVPASITPGNNNANHGILSDLETNNQRLDDEHNSFGRNIPTIDNIYNHLMKQTATNSGYAMNSTSILNPMHTELKRSHSEDSSPANNGCVAIDITNVIAQQQTPLNQQILVPVQDAAVQNFCTAFIKQHQMGKQQQHTAALQQQHDEISIHSPASHISQHTEELSTASASAAEANKFYSHIRQNTPDSYL